jgi:cation transport ATPase
VVLIALAARGVLDPLTGALSQSVAVLAIVANSARILRFASPRGSALIAEPRRSSGRLLR